MKSPTVFVVALATSLAMAAAPSSEALELLGYWDFNDDANPTSVPDIVGNAPALTLFGPAAFSEDAEGASGQAGDLSLELGTLADGSYAETTAGSHFDALGANNAFAVSFFQFNTQVGNTSAFWLAAPGSDGGLRGAQAHTPWSDGTVYFDQSGCCDPPERLTVGAGAITLNQWQHLVFQRDDAGNREIWIDGVLAASAPGADPVDPFDGVLTVGSEGGAHNNSFSGRIDEFAICDNALTEAEIALLNSGAPATDLIDTTDDDGDGLLDAWEQLIIDADPDDAIETIEDVLPGDDFDEDGLDNVGERDATTDPTDQDTDGDGLFDGVESNSGEFVSTASDTGTNPKAVDSDGDGLEDGLENPELPYVDANQPGTDPNKSDTDGDTFGDDVELEFGSDPTNPDDTPLADELSLLAYWDFDDPSDPAVTTDVVAGHVGVLQGGAAYTDDGGGRTGSGGDFGMDFGADATGQTVQVADAAFMNVATTTDGITICFWQKNAGTASSCSFWAVAPGATGNSRGLQAHVPWGNGTIYFDTAGCCDEPATRLQGPPPAGHDWLQWHHYVFLKSGGRREVWIDGALALSTLDGANPLPTNITELWLGSDRGNSSLQAVLDEFAIFDRALSEDQIAELAAGAAPIDLIVPPAPFAITSVVRGGDGRVTLTFNTRPNRIYAVDVSADCVTWDELDDGVEGEGGEATFTDTLSDPAEPQLFYRAREL